jgi:flagellar hook-length control protein FliK
MTAFASNILAALPGVGAKIGAGQGMSTGEGSEAAAGFEAAFAALLASAGQTLDGVQAGTKTGLAGSTNVDEDAETQVDSDGVPSDSLLAEAMLLAPQMLAAQTQPAAASAEEGAVAAPAAAAGFMVAGAEEAAVPAVTTTDDIDITPTPAAVQASARKAPEADLPRPIGASPAPVPPETPEAVALDDVALSAPAAAASPNAPLPGTRPVNAPRTDSPPTPGVRGADAAAALAAEAPVEEAQAPEAAAQAAATTSTAAPVEAAKVLSSAAVVSAVAALQPAANAEKTERAADVPAVEVAEGEEAAAPVDAVPADALVTPDTPEAVAQAPAADTAAKAAAPVEPKRVSGAFDTRAVKEAVEPEALRDVKGEAKVGEAKPAAANVAGAPLAADAEPAAAAPAEAAVKADASSAEPAPAALTTAQTTHAADTAAAARGSPETVARLASDITRKLEGQNSKFELQLDPLGLGKVNVSVEINADGRLTAALSFDTAQAAADLRGRSAELRQALQQAGFDVSENGLSFDLSSQGQGGGFGGRETGQDASSWSSRAFMATKAGLDEADARVAASTYSRAPTGGVDIRI